MGVPVWRTVLNFNGFGLFRKANKVAPKYCFHLDSMGHSLFKSKFEVTLSTPSVEWFLTVEDVFCIVDNQQVLRCENTFVTQ